MTIHNGFDDGESQAGARHTVRDIFAAKEFFENTRLICRKNARTVVSHLQDDLSTFGTQTHLDLSAGRGVFDGIADQIIEHLAQAQWICLHRTAGWGHSSKWTFRLRALDLSTQDIQCVAKDVFQLDDFAAGIESRFEPAEVEQVVDAGR